LAALGYDPANETLDPSTPAGVGNLAAKAMLDFRHNDDSNQLNGYADTTGTSRRTPGTTSPRLGIGSRYACSRPRV
jgi:hypothetical protein